MHFSDRLYLLHMFETNQLRKNIIIGEEKRILRYQLRKIYLLVEVLEEDYLEIYTLNDEIFLSGPFKLGFLSKLSSFFFFNI